MFNFQPSPELLKQLLGSTPAPKPMPQGDMNAGVGMPMRGLDVGIGMSPMPMPRQMMPQQPPINTGGSMMQKFASMPRPNSKKKI